MNVGESQNRGGGNRYSEKNVKGEKEEIEFITWNKMENSDGNNRKTKRNKKLIKKEKEMKIQIDKWHNPKKSARREEIFTSKNTPTSLSIFFPLTPQLTQPKGERGSTDWEPEKYISLLFPFSPPSIHFRKREKKEEPNRGRILWVSEAPDKGKNWSCLY